MRGTFYLVSLLAVFLIIPFFGLKTPAFAQGTCSCLSDYGSFACGSNTCDPGYLNQCTFASTTGECISCTCVSSLPTSVNYSVSIDCEPNPREPHPLRPYPGEICEPPPPSAYNLPYCAMRPWAAKPIEYLKNIQECLPTDPVYPCLDRFVDGDYTIDLQAYELPLVSVNRPGFSSLSFFERTQQHTADYLEGRAFYEGVAEPIPADTFPEKFQIWSRLGVFRKLTSYFIQNQLKITNINRVNVSIHDYIVGYYDPDEQKVTNWLVGPEAVRMSEFDNPDHQPPILNCDEDDEACLEEYFEDFALWQDSRWGKLWAYLPMFSREDTLGYVTLFADPSVIAPTGYITNQVSIPHLPRLYQLTTHLQKALSADFEIPENTETVPYTGNSCGTAYTACPPYIVGCLGMTIVTCEDPDEVDCNQSATATDGCVESQDVIQQLALDWVGGLEGNKVEECYHDVIGRSQDAGVDPCFSMIIWLNESNASNYYISRQDFGINDPQFECSFRAQINQFLLLPDAYQTGWPHCFVDPPINPATNLPMTPMEAFLWIFRTGDCDPTNTAGAEYAASIMGNYNLVCNCDLPEYPK